MCPVVCIKKEAAPPLCVEVPEGKSLLAALERRCNRDVAAGCRGGGCGVCRVRVWSGQFRSKAMSKAHINEEDLRQGVVLACRVFPPERYGNIARRAGAARFVCAGRHPHRNKTKGVAR